MKANCPHKVKIRAGGVIFLLAARYVAWPYEFKKYSQSNQISASYPITQSVAENPLGLPRLTM